MQTVQTRPEQLRNPKQGMVTSALSSQFWLSLLVLLAGCALVYITLATGVPFFCKTELLFAGGAQEMLQSSNFITPLNNGLPCFDKPILSYWVIMAFFKAFGISHVVARIPFVLATVVAVGVTAVGVGVIAGSESGLLSALIMASSYMVISFAALCMSDTLLMFFDVCSLALLFAGTIAHSRRSFLWILGAISMGLAFLTKGPVGLVLPVFSFGLFLTITRQWSLVSLKQVLMAVLAFLGIVAPWFIAITAVNHFQDLYDFFILQNFNRFTGWGAGVGYNTHSPAWFMAAQLFIGLLPWSVLLVPALAYSIKRWRADLAKQDSRLLLYLWLWIAVYTIFFSISRCRVDYYLLPAYPAAAAVVGMYISSLLAQDGRVLRFYGLVLGVGLALLGAGTCLILLPALEHANVVEWLLLQGSVTAAGVASIVFIRRRQHLRAISSICTGICLTAIGYTLLIRPGFLVVVDDPSLAYCEILRHEMQPYRLAVSVAGDWLPYGEVFFRTGHPLTSITGESDLAAFLCQPGRAYAMVPQNVVKQVVSSGTVSVHIIATRPRRVCQRYFRLNDVIEHRGLISQGEPLCLIRNGT